MKNKFTKLIDVKSIITLILVFSASVLTLRGDTLPDEFHNLLLMVMTYFFARKSNGGGEN